MVLKAPFNKNHSVTLINQLTSCFGILFLSSDPDFLDGHGREFTRTGAFVWETGALGALAKPLCRGSESSCPETQWRQQGKKKKTGFQMFHLTFYQALCYLCGLGRALGFLGCELPCSCWIHPKVGSWLVVREEKPSCSYFLLPLPTRRLCSSVSAERRSFLLIK